DPPLTLIVRWAPTVRVRQRALQKRRKAGALAYPVSSVRGVSYVLRVPRPEFPRSVIEFQRRFPDDEACRAYLFASRWPVRLPGLPRRRSRWRAPPSSVAVQVVRPPGIGHGWDGDAPGRTCR